MTALSTEMVDGMIAAGLTREQMAAAVEALERERLAKDEARRRERRERYSYRLRETEWLPLCGEVYRRDGFICAYCGTADGPFGIDHIFPVSRGGSNDPANLCVACRRCNSAKRNLTLSEWRARQ